MPSVTRRPRPVHDATRRGVEQALTGAMERLLASGRSFISVSVEQLANEAGLARSTFYLHFRDKGELVRSLLLQVTREIVDAAEPWFAHPLDAGREGLAQAIGRIAEVYERHRAVMHAVVETSAYDPTVAEIFNGMMQELVSASQRAARAVRKAGRSAPGLTDASVEALTWMVERCCHQLLAQPSRARRAKLIDGMAHAAWRSIYR